VPQVQTTGCVTGLLSGLAVHAGQRLRNRVGYCADDMLFYDSSCFCRSHVYNLCSLSVL